MRLHLPFVFRFDAFSSSKKIKSYSDAASSQLTRLTRRPSNKSDGEFAQVSNCHDVVDRLHKNDVAQDQQRSNDNTLTTSERKVCAGKNGDRERVTERET